MVAFPLRTALSRRIPFVYPAARSGQAKRLKPVSRLRSTDTVLPGHLAILSSYGVPEEKLFEALSIAEHTGESAHSILLTRGWCSQELYTFALALAHGLPLAGTDMLKLDLTSMRRSIRQGIGPQHIAKLDHEACGFDYAVAPLGRGMKGLFALGVAAQTKFNGGRVALTTPRVLREMVFRDARREIDHHARFHLHDKAPEMSARTGLNLIQAIRTRAQGR